MDKRLFYLLDRAHKNVFSQLNRLSIKRFDVPVAQLTGLWALRENEQISMAEFGKRLGLKNSAITGLVQRMRDNKIIEQFRSELDGRSFAIKLTEKGLDIKKSSLPLVSVLNKKTTGEFSEEEISVIVRYFDHMISMSKELENLEF